MNNAEKYKNVFSKSLSIESSKVSSELKYNDIPEWDSIGHMTLISGLKKSLIYQSRLMILLILAPLKKVKKY